MGMGWLAGTTARGDAAPRLYPYPPAIQRPCSGARLLPQAKALPRLKASTSAGGGYPVTCPCMISTSSSPAPRARAADRGVRGGGHRRILRAAAADPRVHRSRGGGGCGAAVADGGLGVVGAAARAAERRGARAGVQRLILANAPLVVVTVDRAGVVTSAEGRGLASPSRRRCRWWGKPLLAVFPGHASGWPAISSAPWPARATTVAELPRHTLEVWCAAHRGGRRQTGSIAVALDISARRRTDGLDGRPTASGSSTSALRRCSTPPTPTAGCSDASDAWLEAPGWRREEVIGRPLLDFMAAESRRSAETELLPLLVSRGHLHGALPLPDPRRRHPRHPLLGGGPPGRARPGGADQRRRAQAHRDRAAPQP